MTDQPTSELRQTLARNVREIRARRGLSQQALAELAGLTQKTISYIENGTDATTIDTLAHIAAALRTKARNLLTED